MGEVNLGGTPMLVMPVTQSAGINTPQGSATNPLYVAGATSGGAVRTPAYIRATASSSVAAGTKSASFTNVGSTDATVLTTTLSPNQSIKFSVDGADTLAAIAYTASATAILAIATVT